VGALPEVLQYLLDMSDHVVQEGRDFDSIFYGQLRREARHVRDL